MSRAIAAMILATVLCACGGANDPISREISNLVDGERWLTRAELDNKYLATGMDIVIVEGALVGFGYQADEDWREYFNARLDPDLSPTTRIFTKRGGDLVCNYHWIVFAKLDSEDQLISADGAIQEAGCL